jgi:hypothetical protein
MEDDLDPSNAGELDPLHAGLDDGEDVTLGDDGDDTKVNADGSTDVELNNQTDTTRDPEFFTNLAESLDEADLAAIALDLTEKIEADKESRDKQQKQYADALRKLGLDGAPPGGAEFEGASKVVHPMLTEASVDFAASAIRELFPMGGETSGPVKHQVLAKPTQKKVDKANRKTEFLNWQLTKQMPGFRASLETVLGQIPMSGVQYLKITWDHARNRPTEMFVPVDKLYIPYDAASFEGAERITHYQELTGFEFDKRVAAKVYREIDLAAPQAPERTDADQASDRAAGKEQSNLNIDETRAVYETLTWLEIESDDRSKGEAAPYLITIDVDSDNVLAIYRAWHPDDPDMEALHNVVEWPFIYWRGGPIGLHQLIGGLSDAATGALRALLDAAQINNFQGAVALKGGSAGGGGKIEMKLGQVTEIEAPTSSEAPDIRKTIMPLPVNPPSAVLMELLGFLSEKGQGVVNVALEKFAEGAGSPDIPVGTVLALIEQGSKVYSAIHARLHAAMERTLKVIHNLNRLYLDEETVIREIGELMIRRADFDGPMDVCPVSDPNIFSETQRFAQVQAVMQRAILLPMLYDLRKVEELFLERMKIPNAKDLLVPKQEPKRLNPINENVAMAMGAPVTAFADQDHIAHLACHFEFALHPLYGQNPLMQDLILGQLANHVKDHLVYLYVSGAVEIAEKTAGVEDISELMDDHPEVQKQFDAAMAQASSITLSKTASLDRVLPNQQLLASYAPVQMMPLLQMLHQAAESLKPPTPQDPEISKTMMAQAKMTEVQQKPQVEQAKEQIKQSSVQAQIASRSRDTQAKIGADHLNAMAKIASDERKNTQDNATAMALAEGEWEHHDDVAVSDGHGINPGS